MGRCGCLVLALWAFGSIWSPRPAVAGQQASSVDDPSSSASAASALPVAPAVITRTPEGQATVRAVRVARPPTFDGRLDDAVYQNTLPIDGFIQQEPQEGAPASEKTDAWILYDDRNIYVAARCWDSHPERFILSELRRDNNNIIQNENLTVVFDTFHDRRNGFFFQTNALGAVRDQTIVDDVLNTSWNGVWDVRVARFESGWTMEMVIPFKTLRYLNPGPQVWGVNFRRIVKWKNEYSYLTAMPASFGTGDAIGRMASAGTLVGLETPGQSKNLEIKPYAVSSLTTDNTARPAFENDADGDIGFDFKYGLTRSLIADATVNTDFAQVEEDLQQVNLTRFSLFFPEKRDFFLEGQGIFAFGGVRFSNGGGSPGDVPLMFFSRRIGLENGQSVPVMAGGRVTGRAGRYTLGAVNIETDDKPSALALQTNFTAVRLKRDVLRRSNVGLIATHRAPVDGVRNTLIGADTNLFLFENVTANLYVAKTDTPGLRGGTESYRGRVDLSRDRYGMTAEHLVVGEHFDPQVGYARRLDFRRSAAEARFTPRPRRATRIRKYTYAAGIDYITNAAATELQNRELAGTFQIDFQNSDQFVVDGSGTYELIPRPFTISPGVIVPAGGYDYANLRVQYNLGQQRRVSGRVTSAYGSFYDGHKTDLIYTGRITIQPQLAIEPGVTVNWVRLPYGEFTSRLFTSRFIVTPTPRIFVSSLIQYNAIPHSLSSSIRLRWEYRPGSELFVVYSDGRNTVPTPTSPGLQNRTFAVKLTRLFRF